MQDPISQARVRFLVTYSYKTVASARPQCWLILVFVLQLQDWHAEHKHAQQSQIHSQQQMQTTAETSQPSMSPQPKQANSAQSQPDQLGSYGLPLHASTSRPSHRFDDATDLASPPLGTQAHASAQDQTGSAQPQFMSGLMGLHGVTTPEEKRRREDKQKQYARELDEQVSLSNVNDNPSTLPDNPPHQHE